MEYVAYTELRIGEPWFGGICRLHDLVFGIEDSQIIQEELSLQLRYLILVAQHEEQVVGYKIGYQERTTRFYSWLGGVHPDFRNQGVANELIRKQHELCKMQGYHVVRTHTRNMWRNMLLLNLCNGFDIVGTRTEHSDTTILLEKRL